MGVPTGKKKPQNAEGGSLALTPRCSSSPPTSTLGCRPVWASLVVGGLWVLPLVTMAAGPQTLPGGL